ncbi:unnamed protein product [Symbiodinium natans]|uniref:Uncharacterized protein n=1 Tax=Symbiodinium natans TaxID=878477 RepID=A0A812PT44_9DINO|nr:unnamed protein product [Symbiodinium natans]
MSRLPGPHLSDLSCGACKLQAPQASPRYCVLHRLSSWKFWASGLALRTTVTVTSTTATTSTITTPAEPAASVPVDVIIAAVIVLICLCALCFVLLPGTIRV